MSIAYVDVPALNFRSEPEVASDTKIGAVFLGQKLSDVEASDTDGWVACSAEIEGVARDGFVSAKFTRPPLSENRERLVASVHREWMRFDRGAGKEHVAPFAGFVGEMWQAIGINLDGTDRDTPWSAAAISFFVRNSGPAYANFLFAAAHSKFTNHAIRARIDGDQSVPFWGFRLNELRPKIGDIICRDNPNFAPAVDFDVAAVQDSFRSHTDVVMSIDSENNKLLAIGGNVSHSVKIAEYDLDAGDFAADTNHTYAILRNITDD